jgi:hypothetical protein
MLSLALAFFDKLLEKLFLDKAKEKIMDSLNRRNVERKISRASDAPAQALEAYFRNENLTEHQTELILNNVQAAIDASNVDAKLLASASLDAEKLTGMILSQNPVPDSITDERLEWPYKMALQIAADTLCTIAPRFSDWEREAWSRNFEGLDKVLENQETILHLVGPGGEGTRDERFEHTYRSYILRRLAQIDASTFRVSSNLFLDLTTVFVQPDVIEVPKRKRKEKEQLQEQVISLEEARNQILAQSKDDTETRLNAEDYVRAHKRCAIVGLPGSGKTTLLQHILLTTAKGDLQFDDAKAIVPVFIKVRQLDFDNLPDATNLVRVAEGSVLAGALPDFPLRQFEAGRVLLLIDGLDEVVDDKRDNLINWIGDFVALYPNARYVVSSRPAGYQSDVFQSLDFSEVMLREFSSEQIQEYVQRWTKAVEMSEGATPEEAETLSEQYAATLVGRAQSNPYVRRIATNPLLLSTLCLVQKYEGGDLPNRRVVLYERCVEGLLFHWDNKRNLPPAILGSLTLERKLMLLRRLSLEMQVRGMAEVNEDEVIKSFGGSLREVGAHEDAKLILGNIRDRSGILVERRPGIYGFSHLTFQEYLAALSINQGDIRAYDRFFLFSKRDDPQWQEVIALYAGLAPKDSVEKLLRELLSTKNPESIVLCGKCLAAAQDASLDLQTETIRALLSLPIRTDDKPIALEVSHILESLDAKVVLKGVTAALGGAPSFHPLFYLLSNPSAEAINSLFEIGKRMLTGQQDLSEYYDDTILIILMLTEHPDSAKALASLADIASNEKNLGNRTKLLMGIFAPLLWIYLARDATAERLSGVFNLLNEPAITDEQFNLCRFLNLTTTITLDIINKGGTIPQLQSLQDAFLLSYTIPRLEALDGKLRKIVNAGNSPAAEHAATASTNLQEILTIAKATMEQQEAETKAARQVLGDGQAAGT